MKASYIFHSFQYMVNIIIILYYYYFNLYLFRERRERGFEQKSKVFLEACLFEGFIQ